ncbi:MAG: nucleotide pyrophosphohydrolase [Candidatus Woesearchaeota archaeon]
MDEKTNLAEMKKRVKDFCEERDWDQFHDAKNLAIGVSTEAAELLEHFRFKSEEEIRQMFMDEKKREEIAFEMADTLFYLLRMAQRYNIDLSEAFEKKMKKNEQRYPVEKFKGSNKKYNEV